MQNEIIEKGVLLDDQGRLARRGYSKKYLLEYNPEKLNLFGWRPLDRLRLKEWDYYGVTTRDFFFSVCLADIGYLGLAFAYFIDFRRMEESTRTLPTPFGIGCALPRSSEKGDAHFHAPGVDLQFIREPRRRRIQVEWKLFSGLKTLAADLTLEQPPEMDSIVMATPIGDRHFYYNHKVNCMPAAGRIAVGDWQRALTPSDALANLDWGRGVWDYETLWVWASASGFLEKSRRFGLNLGLGFGDLSSATENCFFIDGKMSKLGWVDIKYDNRDFKKPWRFIEENGKLDLTLTPCYEKITKMNLAAVRTEVHQMFGRYNGWAIDEAGARHAVKDLIGWAEEHQARW